MKHVSKLLLGATFAAAFAAGCGSNGAGADQNGEELGKLALPLVTHGPSGTRYQLRNAVFDITPYNYYWYGSSTGGASGAGGNPNQVGGAGPAQTIQPSVISVSSEDDLDSDSIQVDLAEGQYSIRLRPGWYLQSVVDGVAQTREAVLLSEQTQWVYVYRRSTSWVSFQFGLGTQELWFNGKVNIDMQVYEDPDQIYGSTGGASWSTGGSSWAATGGARYDGTGGAPY